MDFEITVGVCKSCNGLDDCNRYCMLHAGKVLVDFLDRIDTTPTRIGEYSKRDEYGPVDLVVSGHYLHSLDDPSWLLTDISTVLDASPKFNSAFDKSPIQLINNYCNKVGIPKDVSTEYAETIKKLNKNKILILPFKPHASCSIDYEDEMGNKHTKVQANIKILKWRTDKETHKLVATIVFKTEKDDRQRTIPVTEYLKSFRLSSMDILAKDKGNDIEMISITDYGIIKPIVVKEAGAEYAIDGTYMYCTINGDTRIVGKWNTAGDLEVNTPKNKSKAFKKIIDNLPIIKNHKRYIAPYKLFSPNELTV